MKPETKHTTLISWFESPFRFEKNLEFVKKVDNSPACEILNSLSHDGVFRVGAIRCICQILKIFRKSDIVFILSLTMSLIVKKMYKKFGPAGFYFFPQTIVNYCEYLQLTCVNTKGYMQ